MNIVEVHIAGDSYTILTDKPKNRVIKGFDKSTDEFRNWFFDATCCYYDNKELNEMYLEYITGDCLFKF